MTAAPCRLWTVGHLARRRSNRWKRSLFFPRRPLVAVLDPSRILRLVETETGRTLARLESPDLCGVREATFSPDGSRLACHQPRPGVHVWDLRAIRKHLAEMGLDWDAPRLSDDDPAGPRLTPAAPDPGRLRATPP